MDYAVCLVSLLISEERLKVVLYLALFGQFPFHDRDASCLEASGSMFQPEMHRKESKMGCWYGTGDDLPRRS